MKENVMDDGLSTWCVTTLKNHLFFKPIEGTDNLGSFINTSLYSSNNFYVLNWLKNCTEFKFCSYMYNMENEDTWYKYDEFINTRVINKYESFDCYSQTISSISTISSAPDDILNNSSNRKMKKKSTRAKTLYDLKKTIRL